MEKDIYFDSELSKLTIRHSEGMVAVTVESRQQPYCGDENCFAGPTVIFPLADYARGLEILRDHKFCEVENAAGYMKITKNDRGEVRSIELSDRNGWYCSVEEWKLPRVIKLRDL